MDAHKIRTTQGRGRLFDSILDTVGDTPVIRINNLAPAGVRVYVKAEFFNPAASVKDRLALNIIEAAERAGTLQPGQTVVEATSGNTGIGLAYVAASLGYRCIFTMQDTMTVERRNLLRALGCKVVLTEGAKGASGAIAKAKEIVTRLGARAWMPSQFDNPANPAMHYRTTGPEIWADTDGRVDVFVAGVGTGGTLTGVGKYLREQKPEVRIVAVEPAESAVLSGGPAGPHQQQGIGAGFIPGNLDATLPDEILRVTNADAIATTRRLAREEAIFAGISSGSITWAALQVASRPESRGKLIVSIVCDFGERYLSHPVYANLPDPDFSEFADELD